MDTLSAKTKSVEITKAVIEASRNSDTGIKIIQMLLAKAMRGSSMASSAPAKLTNTDKFGLIKSAVEATCAAIGVEANLSSLDVTMKMSTEVEHYISTTNKSKKPIKQDQSKGRHGSSRLSGTNLAGLFGNHRSTQNLSALSRPLCWRLRLSNWRKPSVFRAVTIGVSSDFVGSIWAFKTSTLHCTCVNSVCLLSALCVL